MATYISPQESHCGSRVNWKVTWHIIKPYTVDIRISAQPRISAHPHPTSLPLKHKLKSAPNPFLFPLTQKTLTKY